MCLVEKLRISLKESQEKDKWKILKPKIFRLNLLNYIMFTAVSSPYLLYSLVRASWNEALKEIACLVRVFGNCYKRFKPLTVCRCISTCNFENLQTKLMVFLINIVLFFSINIICINFIIVNFFKEFYVLNSIVSL